MTALSAGEELAEHGISQAVNAADLSWLEAAHARLDALIYLRVEFSSEDVLDALAGMGLRTRDTRALGGVLRKAQRDGRIRAVGWEPARRASRHAAPVRVWCAA